MRRRHGRIYAGLQSTRLVEQAPDAGHRRDASRRCQPSSSSPWHASSCNAATAEKAGCLGICVVGFDRRDAARQSAGNAGCRRTSPPHLANCLRSRASPRQSRFAASVCWVSTNKTGPRSRISAEANGNNLARWLTTLPPNKLDAERLCDMPCEDHWPKTAWLAYKRFGYQGTGEARLRRFLAVAPG